MTIVWRRIDVPGHEAADLLECDGGWELSGTAVFAHPARLNYVIRLDASFETRSAQVFGRVGNEDVRAEIHVDRDRRWHLNGEEVPAVANCIDIDLNFSPSTNLIPIRRLGLEIGEEGRVRAAWLRFPSFRLELLEQSYRRTGASTYRYESGSFTADLEVDARGFPMSYSGVWQLEPASR